MKTKIAGLCLLLITLYACNEASQSTKDVPYGNPAAEGFNAAASDAKAIAIADEVMEAMGGREAWDNTRHLCWKFFGARELVWDKWTGDVRLDFRNMTFLINVNDDKGQVFVDGMEITDSDSLQKMVNRGKSIWINDSYWLAMPFKLKDSGVTLKYMGEEQDQQGANCEKLELTFESVGVTPDNRYWVWVDKEKKLISQWAFYRNAADSAQGFNLSIHDYKQMGDVLLSTGRGDRNALADVMVFDELPESVYNSADKPDLKSMVTQ